MTQPLDLFHPVIAEWFRSRVGTPTAVQARAWPVIARGEHALVTAPTGSGKTLTAFLWALDRLLTGAWAVRRGGSTGGDGPKVLYVSPLKALNTDVRRNLLTPLEELRHAFAEAGEEAPDVTVATRSGDTPQNERRRMLRQPPEILITTPESLNILLTSQSGRRILGDLETVILDEIHAVAGSKRGTHLITAVERLTLLSGEFQRIALSATVRPLERIARFVGGRQRLGEGPEPGYRPRPVTTVRGGDGDDAKEYNLRVTFPEALVAWQGETADEARNGETPDPLEVVTQRDPRRFWEILAEDFRRHIRANRSTLLFANSRRLTEKVTRYINEAPLESGVGPAGERGTERTDLAYSHHGSLSREIRQVVEERLKDGRLASIVATSSLELGIDIGALDEVLLIQTPPTIAAAVQRIGRAGHGVGQVSRARLYPTFGRDFLDAAVMARAVLDGEIEELKPVRGALDVLAQVILSMTIAQTWDVDELLAFLHSTEPYRELSHRQYELVLEMLAGRYADTRLRELKPRVRVDRLANTVTARRGAARLIYMAGGTIPDRGYYNLRLEGSGAKVGELDEEFVWERSVGDTFTLGAQSWRIRQVTHNDVLVTPSRRGASLAPFWRAEARDRSAFLSEKIGRFLERAERFLAEGRGGTKHLLEVLAEEYATEPTAAGQLVELLVRQRSATGAALPSHRHLVVEQVAAKRSDGLAAGSSAEREILFHTFWGGQVHRPWALALAAAWEEKHGTPLPVIHDDDCLVVHAPAEMDPGEVAEEVLSLVPPHRIEELLRHRLEATGFFGARFREAAGRALLLPRAGFDRRVPLWLTRLRSKKLLEAVREYADFPLVLETWRACLEDELDLESLRQRLGELDAGEIRVTRVTTDQPSPFAANLVWRQTNRLMYEDDTPEGAGGSALGDDLLREVVFSSQLRPRLPGELIERFQGKLQRTWPGYAPLTAVDLLDWLRERLFLPLPEWRRLLDAVRRDARAEGIEGAEEPAWLDGLLEPLAGRAVRLTLPASSLDGVAAVESLPRMLEALDLDPNGVGLGRLGGNDASEDPVKDTAARGALLELLEDHRRRRELLEDSPDEMDDETEDRLVPWLGEWLRFHGPVPKEHLEASLGLASERLSSALEALAEEERVVVDRFRVAPGEGVEAPQKAPLELCDAENLEVLLRLLRAEARPSFEALPLDHLPLFLAHHQGIATAGGELADLRDALDRLFGYPAPAAAWEELLLPARLAPYYTSWLDTLLQESELVWLGTGRERLTFCFASDLDLFVEQPEDEAVGEDDGDFDLTEDPTGGLLPDGPGSFTVEEVAAHSGLDPTETTERLWRLAWEGRITNTTALALRRGILARFQGSEAATRGRAPARPARAGTASRPLASRPLTGRRRRAFDRWRPAPAALGAWYRLDGQAAAPLGDAGALDALEQEELDRDRVRQLLTRYGVLFRELLQRELPALQWGRLFRTLRRMELSGEVTTGHFFDDVPGLQFIAPGALRTLRQGLPADAVYWVSALDPAAPCGLGLDAWKGEMPSRLPSNHLVFHGPRRVVTARRNGAEMEIEVDPDHPHAADYLAFLEVLLTRDFNPVQRIDVEVINGEDAAGTPWARWLRERFQATGDHRKVILRRRY